MQIKKIVIAGCRNFTDYAKAEEFIDKCIINIRKKYELIFISGGHRDPPLRYHIKFCVFHRCRLLQNNIRFGCNQNF